MGVYYNMHLVLSTERTSFFIFSPVVKKNTSRNSRTVPNATPDSPGWGGNAYPPI